jgi:tellurite methyltransferase
MNSFLLSFFLLISIPSLAYGQKKISAKRYELLRGVKRPKDTKSFWDKKYGKNRYIFGKRPAEFLADNYHFLKANSKVLDVGMGEGRNAVFLARMGFDVTGTDISSVAVRKAKGLAREFRVHIKAKIIPTEKYIPPAELFDGIIVFYYVDRKLTEKLKSWLRPGGILIYEAYTDKQSNMKGFEQYEKRYLLRPGELLGLFKGMKVLKYVEPVHLNKFTSSIILQKQ